MTSVIRFSPSVTRRARLLPSSERWKVIQRYREANRRLKRMERDLEIYNGSQGVRELLRVHVAYLDKLTLESHGFTDYRNEFITFYLTYRPERRGRHK